MRGQLWTVAASAVAIVACGPGKAGIARSSDSTRASDSLSAMAKSLDSCNRIVYPADARDSTRPMRPHVNLSKGTIHAFRRFSLFVPSGATPFAIYSAEGGLKLNWPGCERCRFSVRLVKDPSGGGIDAWAADAIARQRVIDSTNSDPRSVAYEFDEIVGLPQQFRTATGRGYLIHEACGDCAAEHLIFGRPGYIADVQFGGDDDIPQLAHRICEMTVVGKTFEWRD